MKYKTPHYAASVAFVSFLSMSLVAEAGLIRGGGRGARTIIESSMFAGTVPFLVADPMVSAPEVPDQVLEGVTVIPPVSPTMPTSLTGADLTSAAAYGYGPSGFQASVSHNWGRDCALTIECVFELQPGEVLDWMGHIVGLPPVLPDGMAYDAVADLVVTWDLTALQAPPPGFSTTGPLPSRNLASWSTTFAADPDRSGNYLSGVGSPAITLGESISYVDAVAQSESDPSCFATIPGRPISTLPPSLPIADVYSRGDCREIGFDLSQAIMPVSGADLDALLTLPREFLNLTLSVELVAPTGYEFASLIEAGAPFGNDAYVPGVSGLSTPSGLRGLDDSIEYAGCVGGGDCDRVTFSSFGLRIDVVGVPVPSTLWLIGAGVVLVWRRSLAGRVRR